MALLSDADIAVIRRDWIGDEVNRHAEWGTASVVATGASAGATSLALSGLATTGTITKNTPFIVTSVGRRDRYTVLADATITAGAATVTFSPGLVNAATAADRAVPEVFYRTVFNKRTQRAFFSDAQLLDMAERALLTWPEKIEQNPDRLRALYRAVRCLCLREMLGPGSEYTAVMLADDPRGNAAGEVARLERVLDGDERYLSTKQNGPRTIWIEK